jgi:UDP-N-acetylglucosamine--N-acetylmuramyl-(pentapeptide) pyrophosphoryl-undecaprenol N-acetylglucosamine transferase
MRVILTGGGTGGHIYPALAIARGLQKEDPRTEILFVGTETGLETDVVPKAGFKLATVSAQGLERRLSLQALAAGGRLLAGCVQARRIIRQFRPDVVVGTGGYVCAPVVLMAALAGIPTAIHEQNAFPGLANRFLARFVDRVFLTFGDARQHFCRKARTTVTGLPVRPEILNSTREAGRAFFGLDRDRFTLLVMGGSRGARSINRSIVSVYKEIARHPGIQVLHITGAADYEATLAALRDTGLELANCGNIILKPYVYEMEHALAAADLVVCRAGAATLAELTVLGKPAILVPFPYASENHQEYNARSLVNRQAAVMILDRDLTGDRLWAEVLSLLAEQERLALMREQSLASGKPEALARITGSIRELAGCRR